MIQTLEAVIDERGTVRLLNSVQIPVPRRALVTILDEAPAEQALEISMLSEPALAEDWNREEEEAAWSYLQQAK